MIDLLRERGFSVELIQAILSHADHLNLPRDTKMKQALYAVDEVTGFAGAVALVRPDKKIASVAPSSFKKKMKDKAFARAVNRDDLRRGAEEIGLPLDQHVANVIAFMRERADVLGLRGTL